MSKNTRDTKFRRVDVDVYSEDRYEDEVAGDTDDQGPNEAEVNNLLARLVPTLLLQQTSNQICRRKSGMVHLPDFLP